MIQEPTNLSFTGNVQNGGLDGWAGLLARRTHPPRKATTVTAIAAATTRHARRALALLRHGRSGQHRTLEKLLVKQF